MRQHKRQTISGTHTTSANQLRAERHNDTAHFNDPKKVGNVPVKPLPLKSNTLLAQHGDNINGPSKADAQKNCRRGTGNNTTHLRFKREKSDDRVPLKLLPLKSNTFKLLLAQPAHSHTHRHTRIRVPTLPNSCSTTGPAYSSMARSLFHLLRRRSGIVPEC